MAAQHILVVAFSAQGHINPACALAERLARANIGARVTLSAPVSAHRLMFPSLAAPDEEVDGGDGAVSYVPYSDGNDHGFSMSADSGHEASRYEAFRRVGRETLSAVLDRLAARGRPVTRVVYAMLMSWATEVARERDIPRALYCIQPATRLAVYYHYFHGYEKLVTEHADEPGFTVAMPSLRPLAIRDLPSFFTNLTDQRIAGAFASSSASRTLSAAVAARTPMPHSTTRRAFVFWSDHCGTATTGTLHATVSSVEFHPQ